MRKKSVLSGAALGLELHNASNDQMFQVQFRLEQG